MLLRVPCGLFSESLIVVFFFFSCLRFANSPQKKRTASKLVVQLEYIISNGWYAVMNFSGSVLGLKTIQIKFGNEEALIEMIIPV